MSCRPTVDEDIEIQFGGYRDGFELVIHRAGPVRLVRIGQEFLAEPVVDDSTAELDVVDELIS